MLRYKSVFPILIYLSNAEPKTRFPSPARPDMRELRLKRDILIARSQKSAHQSDVPANIQASKNSLLKRAADCRGLFRGD